VQAINTPLHTAAVSGDLDAVRVLIENKANVSAKNNVSHIAWWFYCCDVDMNGSVPV
jgi:ankyrin repeat protein